MTDFQKMAQQLPPLVTGPLSAAARIGVVGKPRDAGDVSVILTGVAVDLRTGAKLRVRMEMTLEDAEDTARSMWQMAQAAKRA